jgi:hypothetical protein
VRDETASLFSLRPSSVPAEVISHGVWLYFRFLLSLRILAARGFGVSHETVRQWALKFGQDYTNRIRRRRPDMTRPLNPDYDPARSTQFEVARRRLKALPSGTPTSEQAAGLWSGWALGWWGSRGDHGLGLPGALCSRGGSLWLGLRVGA